MASATIPRFLLPRGLPSPNTIRTLTLHRRPASAPTAQCAFSTSPRSSSSAGKNINQNESNKPRVLEKPDRFRPPSHPARRVVATRNGRVLSPGPVNYPGPKLSEKELEEQKYRKYPHMFPPEGTVMHKFLTNRWIHIWIAMSVLTTLATFTFTTNFKRTSPFAHLLPPWSGLLSHPIDTISQAVSVYKMHVQHTSMVTREKRHRRVEDAEKRRQYRIAHGLEEPEVVASRDGLDGDEQSPVAVEHRGKEDGVGLEVASASSAEDSNAASYVDWEGRRRPVKKWLGIW